MKQTKLWMLVAILFICGVFVVNCSNNSDDKTAYPAVVALHIPKAPDYRDASMWIMEDGDIHSCEPWLYSECLAENFAVRAKAWRKMH